MLRLFFFLLECFSAARGGSTRLCARNHRKSRNKGPLTRVSLRRNRCVATKLKCGLVELATKYRAEAPSVSAHEAFSNAPLRACAAHEMPGPTAQNALLEDPMDKMCMMMLQLCWRV